MLSSKKITLRFGTFSGIVWRKRRARFRVMEVEILEKMEGRDGVGGEVEDGDEGGSGGNWE